MKKGFLLFTLQNKSSKTKYDFILQWSNEPIKILGIYFGYDQVEVVIDVVKSLHGCDRKLIFNVVSQLRSMQIPITSIWEAREARSFIYYIILYVYPPYGSKSFYLQFICIYVYICQLVYIYICN